MNEDVNTHVVHRDDDEALPTQREAKRRPLILAIVTLLLAGAGYIFLTGGSKEQASPVSKASMAVTNTKPVWVEWAETLEAQGPVLPWQEAIIGSQIGGYRLTEVRVDVGDQVRREQVLARLDPAILRAEEAQLLAQNDQARMNDQRARGLSEVGGISDQEALRYETEARTARAALNAKRLELRYTAVVAPDDGVVSARSATLGAVVPAGEELFRLIRDNRLEWRGELTADQINRVRPGQAIEIELPDGSFAHGRIRKIAPKLDERTRVAIAYADLLPGSRARAEMFVSGHVSVGQSPALVVSAAAIVVRDGRSYVFLVETTGNLLRVKQQEVVTGRRRGQQVEVVRGLSGEERVVLRGAAFLNDRDHVTVASAQGAGR